MSKTYRTAQGRSLDIEKLRLQNELVPAIGNMRVNARGDQLGPGGKIVKNREDMVDEYYNNTRKNKGAMDEIPTKGGKSKRVESFEPGKIQEDPLLNSDASKKDLPIEDDFVDPDLTVVDKESPTVDPVTGIAAGEKSIKGGLAKAVARTRDYEKNLNSKTSKPKRL